MPGSGKYLHVDVAISLKVLELLIHLVAGMDRDSFFGWFAFSEFLLDRSDLGAFKGLLKYLLDETGDDSAL